MSRSPGRQNAFQTTSNCGNKQAPLGIACPTCDTVLPHDHPLLRAIRENSELLSKAAFEKRLARDTQFAQRYLALQELARTGSSGRDLAEQAEAIVRDEPAL